MLSFGISLRDNKKINFTAPDIADAYAKLLATCADRATPVTFDGFVAEKHVASLGTVGTSRP